MSITGTPASEISDNEAGGGTNDVAGEGGGIYVQATGLTVSISGAEINGNVAGAQGGSGNGNGGGSIRSPTFRLPARR